MSNYFGYELKVRGGAEEVRRFLSFTYAFGNTPPSDRWLALSEIFSEKIIDEGNGMASVEFSCGNSKGPWSELLDADIRDDGRISLYSILEELGLVAEMYINGDEWASHLIIENGIETLSEDAYNYDPILEPGEYGTFEEWSTANGLPEGIGFWDVLDAENKCCGEDVYTPEDTWEKLNADPDGYGAICFHYGGFGGAGWTI